MFFLVKTALSAFFVAAVSEVGKRSALFGAVLISLPLTSALSIVWIYYETRDTQRVTDFAHGVLWVVPPSLIFFVVLPWLLKSHVRFAPAMLATCGVTALSYGLYIFLLKKFGFWA